MRSQSSSRGGAAGVRDLSLVEQTIGDDFVIARPGWFERFGGLEPAAGADVARGPAAWIEPDSTPDGGTLFDVTEIRRMLDRASLVASQSSAETARATADAGDLRVTNSGSIIVEDEAWEIPTKTMPSLEAMTGSAGGLADLDADAERIESLFASFLRVTEEIPEIPVETVDTSFTAARTTPDLKRRLRAEPDLLEPPSEPPPDPRLVALELLEEAEIYRRFGHPGEAQQCVLRARQLCPADAEVQRRARQVLAAIG